MWWSYSRLQSLQLVHQRPRSTEPMKLLHPVAPFILLDGSNESFCRDSKCEFMGNVSRPSVPRDDVITQSGALPEVTLYLDSSCSYSHHPLHTFTL